MQQITDQNAFFINLVSSLQCVCVCYIIWAIFHLDTIGQPAGKKRILDSDLDFVLSYVLVDK